jgi:hypothetical protein
LIAFSRASPSWTNSTKGINAVGTILKTRVGQPIFTVNESNLPQDEFVAKFCGEPGTGRKGLFIWKDTKPFRVASNFHGSEAVKVQRKQRYGSFRTKSCPKAIGDYVDNMGGVDTVNQLRSYYERDRKSKNSGTVSFTPSWKHVW